MYDADNGNVLALLAFAALALRAWLILAGGLSEHVALHSGGLKSRRFCATCTRRSGWCAKVFQQTSVDTVTANGARFGGGALAIGRPDPTT